MHTTQEGILDDDIPEERNLGIEAGLAWGKHASKTVVYTNLGITPGMEKGIQRAREEEREIEHNPCGIYYWGSFAQSQEAESDGSIWVLFRRG